MDVSQFPLRISGIADALQARAAAAAATAMATEFHGELTDVTLRKSSHPRGTKTPSAPGSPPSLVGGTLRQSARIIPAVSAGTRATAEVRVSTVYARIQEKGGVVTAKRTKYLRFQYPNGSWHSVKSVRIPARPYMAPTRDLLLVTGRLRAKAAQAVAAVAREGAA